MMAHAHELGVRTVGANSGPVNRVDNIPRLRPADYRPLLRAALREDLGRAGDLTTKLFVPPKTRLKGRIVSRETGKRACHQNR